MTRWRELLVSIILVAAGCSALCVRHLVATEAVDDRTGLMLAGAIVIALVVGAGTAIRHAMGRKGWRARLAAGTVPVALLLIFAAFSNASLVDASVAMQSIVEANSPSGLGASVELGPSGHDIRLTGELREGVARRLEALLTAHPDVARIHLTSEGGLADEGQAVGDVIAAHGLTTFVPDYCVSACTLAFVQGRERLVLQDSRVGFHAPYEQGLYGALYKGDASIQRSAYIAAGVAPDFVDHALRIDPSDMWFPSVSQLLAAHVITAPADRYRMPDSNLDGSATLDGARALLLRNFPLLKVFGAQSPRSVDLIAGWYLDAYRRERSEGENTDGLTTIVRSAVGAALARSDDATLLDLARYLGHGVALASAQHVCAAIAGKADLFTAATLLAKSDTNAEAAAAALLQRALNGRHILAKSAGPVPTQTRLALPASLEPSKSCDDWRHTLTDLLSRRPAEIASAMRALVDAQAYESIAAMKAVWRTRG